MDIREHIKAEGIKEGRQEGWQKGRLAGRQEGQQEAALKFCKEKDATLIVTKLDRLSRDLEFIGWIQQ